MAGQCYENISFTCVRKHSSPHRVIQLNYLLFSFCQLFGEETTRFPKIFLRFRSSSFGDSWASQRFTYHSGKVNNVSGKVQFGCIKDKKKLCRHQLLREKQHGANRE